MARARKPVEFVSNVPADAPAAWAYRSSATTRRRRAPASTPAGPPAPKARSAPKAPPAPKTPPAAKAPPAPAPAARRSGRRPRRPAAAAPPPVVRQPCGSALQRALALALLPFAAIVIAVRSPRS